MNKSQKQEILQKTKLWFKTSIAENHIKNTTKLSNPDSFIINPFLVKYLAHYFFGKCDAASIAKVLIYPRILSTSINTSLGTHLQTFTTSILHEVGFGSTIEGIDIEFVDQVDKCKKYCQIKMGPNTINKDDVTTINNHFKAVKNRAQTNNVSINLNDLIIGVLYGEEADLSSHYKKLRNDFHYPVFVGQDFWQRLTGDKDFYSTFINTIANVAAEYNSTSLIQKTVKNLASSDVITKILAS